MGLRKVLAKDIDTSARNIPRLLRVKSSLQYGMTKSAQNY